MKTAAEVVEEATARRRRAVRLLFLYETGNTIRELALQEGLSPARIYQLLLSATRFRVAELGGSATGRSVWNAAKAANRAARRNRQGGERA